MIITLSLLKNHLTISSNLEKIINKLTDIGLEVEAVKEAQNELSNFKIVHSFNLFKTLSNNDVAFKFVN